MLSHSIMSGWELVAIFVFFQTPNGVKKQGMCSSSLVDYTTKGTSNSCHIEAGSVTGNTNRRGCTGSWSTMFCQLWHKHVSFGLLTANWTPPLLIQPRLKGRIVQSGFHPTEKPDNKKVNCLSKADTEMNDEKFQPPVSKRQTIKLTADYTVM